MVSRDLHAIGEGDLLEWEGDSDGFFLWLREEKPLPELVHTHVNKS